MISTVRKADRAASRAWVATRRAYATTAPAYSKGVGLGNVSDQMLPTEDERRGSAMFRHTARPKTVSVIGAPMTHGQPYFGTDTGPGLLRRAGLLSDLTSLGWRVNDVGDIDCVSPAEGGRDSDHAGAETDAARNSLHVGGGCERIANTVEGEIWAGRFPLIVGGDHSIAIGSLAGILRARPDSGILWVDAHADLNTPEMSESGNMHGMPIGLLMEGLMEGDCCASIPGLEWLDDDDAHGPRPRLKPSQVVYVGLRDVDRAERAAISDLGIRAYTMYDIDHYGIGSVMDRALQHLLAEDPDRPIHLSYDIDAVDPIHAPATGTAVRGGLTYREAHFIAEFAANSGNLASAEIVEMNPTLSDGEGGEETVDLAKGIVTSLMGKSII